jgi:hypothetical protein
MIVGDGIRNEAEILLGDMHRYARFEFALALIELAVFRMPEPNRLLIRPRTLAKTEVVRRVMFGTTAEASSAEQAAPVSEKVETLSSEAYWSALQASTPSARPALERLIEAAEPLGVYSEFRASLMLKWARPAGASPVNLGYILRSGEIWTDLAAWHVPKDLARQYVEAVAIAFECEVRKSGEGWSVYRNGKALRISDVLDRLQAWVPAMHHFIGAVAKHDAAGG